jgi:serine/threonine protein kinase
VSGAQTPAPAGAMEPTTLQPQTPPASDQLTQPRTDSSLELTGGYRPNLPGYEIMGVIERGGMGVIYKALQAGINRIVALKMIRSGECADAQELVRFQVEAQAVARLDHPHIVRIYDFGEWSAGESAQALPYFSMEFVEGGSLDKELAAGPLPIRRAAELAETLARTVHFVHQRGIVHRDLKPANVLLTADGTPKIADFGLAKKLDGDLGLTMTKTVMGTASYMAPEQAAGRTREVGPAADIYAIGAILYEMLTGRPPFKAETRELTIFQVMSDDPLPPTRHRLDVPRDLEAIGLKCLEKDPALRYANAEALADDLGRWRAGEPISIAATTDEDRHVRWAKRIGYEILELLGCGRTGFVYKARQISLNRLVTLKLLPAPANPDLVELGRFQAEAEAVARLHHPQIAQIYDLGDHQGQSYLVFDYVDGVNLAEKLVDGPLPAREAAELTESLARTLHYAHQRGIVHCGLTPSCVLITTEGIPKITRFGLARMLGHISDRAEEESPARRLPSYLAPEQIDGESQAVAPSVDVYGLGAILYFLLTGQPPFLAESLRATREQVLSQAPRPPSAWRTQIPRELEAVALRCLSKDPNDRYPSMEALARELQRFLATDHSRDDAAMARRGRTAIPGYVISGELGRSSRGVVYKALQAGNQRMVALKLITVEAREAARLHAVLEKARALSHPQITAVYEIGEHSGGLFAAIEYVPGGSLAQQAGSPMPAARAAQLLAALARAIDYAHGQGMIHGGLKPANILMTADGSPKVTDFGFAQAGAGDMSIRGYHYLAPEQARGDQEIGPAVDIFALGTILYELLSGQVPFRGDTPGEIQQQIITAEPLLPTRLQPDIPSELEAVCLRCLEKAPSRRYATAAALSVDLARFVEGAGLSGIWKRLLGWVKGRTTRE